MVTLKFRLTVEGMDEETFVVREYRGHETLSDGFASNEPVCYGFQYQIQLASRQSNISADDIIDKNVLLELLRNGTVEKRVHGIVREFSKADTGYHHTFYSLTLVPAIERLSLRHNSRIFQQKTVPEIISILLQEMGINDYAFSLTRDSQVREFCTQYRETDIEFMHRLAAEEGMVYSFIHNEDKHTVLFCDDSKCYPNYAGVVPYNNLSGGNSYQPYVSCFIEKIQAEVSHSTLKDYSFKKPEYGFLQQQQASDIGYQNNTYEHYDYPGRYKSDVSGVVFNEVRLDYLRRESHLANGKSDNPRLQAGTKFDLSEHLDPTRNREWLVVSVTHTGTQPQALEEEAGTGETSYRNEFTVIPTNKTWQATPHTKPQVDGPMIAIVVGPKGEEIFCDEFGRVKLHFPWDRYSNTDEHSSCWVRVSQGWAGPEYGMVAVPRIGQEVIVSFLNGDPDQPIVTGRTYNAINTPPYPLPDDKTKTVIRTKTHLGEGYNELSFEDQSGAENVYLRAQKNFDAEIKNDSTTVVKHDQHTTIDNDSFTQVKGSAHLTVHGEQRVKVGSDFAMEVGGLQQKAASQTILDVGDEVHLKAGNKVVVDAGSAITIAAGGSFVKVDAGGVHVVGPAINMNSGGSAGSGSSYSGLAAELPMGLEEIAAPEDVILVPKVALEESMSPLLRTRQIEALQGAEPICEVCEEAKNNE
ncbi:type VI secretion system Vgr family protein [Vibrio paucivorans]|uniref:Type VI secretion system tip protein VgrG n=1 Tax=Vibrio paucivorans TaxID=2829489 RepID=A0A9X3HRK4_9VIBR|nr:type VI secretion system tip protein TssI/VgrG [Vibrio paucivorans]MCW8334210.1 type VI secretion system tip protein VgrG [Vibrio paucivorans]